ncbi:uncharacterized protein LOC112463683 [Temnothorax curvispinosus]|uniref:Uncharacterized protein LOC112463683 n=1 Tax=Temnothorax curvispinosus TaxID=300111 RepID=A0A6J1QTU8_9HYME|nr:uncharacterized protein LOC112463683 [Temnothorax curvispinosus]
MNLTSKLYCIIGPPRDRDLTYVSLHPRLASFDREIHLLVCAFHERVRECVGVYPRCIGEHQRKSWRIIRSTEGETFRVYDTPLATPDDGWKARGTQQVSDNLKRETGAPRVLHRITKYYYARNFKHL